MNPDTSPLSAFAGNPESEAKIPCPTLAAISPKTANADGVWVLMLPERCEERVNPSPTP
jgi:hypothetical protein